MGIHLFTVFFFFFPFNFQENFSCGRYQPDTLPILEISESSADEKLNYVVADIPFVIGDRVKFTVKMEELREMMVDSGVGWGAPMKKVIN